VRGFRLCAAAWALLALACAGPAAAHHGSWVYTKTYRTSSNLGIPDGSFASLSTTIEEAGQITDLNVAVRVTHPAAQELSLSLGVSYPGVSSSSALAIREGGAGADYGTGNADCSGTLTVFDEQAATSIGDGTAPFTGSYRPVVPFGSYFQTRGTWRFAVSDIGGGFSGGAIRCWELRVTREPDIVVDTDPGSAAAIVQYFAPFRPGLVTQNCNPPSGSAFPIGPTTVTCTANRFLPGPGPDSDTENFTVTVRDRERPVITAPADIVRGNDPDRAGAIVTYPPPTASDNASGVMTFCSPPSGSFFPLGTTTVTCTATDTSGNTATDTFRITVIDIQPPDVAVPPNQTVNNDPGQASARVSYPPATATDNAPGVAIACAPASGSVFPIGTTTVTCVARDAAGNETTRTFTVTVRDAEPPTIRPPASTRQGNDLGRAGAVVRYPAPEASDNAPGTSYRCAPAAGTFFPIGTTRVSCTATDAAGNTASASFAVSVSLVRCTVLGNRRANRLGGTRRVDWICGAGGNDRIAPGAGNDIVDGGAGSDRVLARGGGRDRIRCGSGRDTVVADRRDRVARDCETVQRK
jgi:hypothetical protein